MQTSNYPDYKTCTLCSYHKPLKDFPKNSKGLYGRGQKCNSCSAHLAKLYRQQHPIKKAALKFKVSEQEIKEVYYKQTCDICGDSFKSNKRHAIDHCHTTGKVRGLLCSQCNTGLGMFHDDISKLQRAIDYLKGKYA